MTTRAVEAAAGVFAPGHLGELTQVLDFPLVDAVIAECGAGEKRCRLLPSRVVVYFVLALALFEHCSYLTVWGRLAAGLGDLAGRVPAASSLVRARRRVGYRPFRALFEAIAGPVGRPDRPGVFYRGLRVLALDGTSLHVPDHEQVTWHYPKRVGEAQEFGYPLLRLLVLVEAGTRALVGACFGPESTGELGYARSLSASLKAGMLLLADAGFDAFEFLSGVEATGAQFLVRGSARRIPTVQRRLADGSYLAVVSGRYRAGEGYRALTVRVIEAVVTVTDSNGRARTEPWRLITGLLDERAHPARDLVALYHRRWQVETTYFSIKSSLLDGRVLRSRGVDGIAQEVWALLTVYQALVRVTADAADTSPDLAMDRISFTVALETAAETVVTARGLGLSGPIALVGAIGTAVLARLWPAHRPQRAKARSKKNPTSKYGPNAGTYPQTSVTYTFSADITIFEHGLAARRSS